MDEPGEALADEARRCGIEHMTPEQLKALRAYLRKLRPKTRVRALQRHGDGLAEHEIDRVWSILDRRPTAAELRELEALFREAATYCAREAKRKL